MEFVELGIEVELTLGVRLLPLLLCCRKSQQIITQEYIEFGRQDLAVSVQASVLSPLKEGGNVTMWLYTWVLCIGY